MPGAEAVIGQSDADAVQDFGGGKVDVEVDEWAGAQRYLGGEGAEYRRSGRFPSGTRKRARVSFPVSAGSCCGS